MKAAAFDYMRPRNVAAAVDLLAADKGQAQLLAGGQSLLPLLNLRLASPARLIDISRLPELAMTDEDDATVTLGAGVTHAMIEDRRVPDPSQGLMPHVALGLAYRAVRNRGTLGGSLALADPAAEWPAVLAALEAEIGVVGPNGRRRLSGTNFATGIYATRLAEDEIVTALRIPKLSRAARWGYAKLARKAGAFADALAVAVADPRRGYGRVVLGAANGPPLVMTEAGRALAGTRRDPEQLRRAVETDLDSAADRRFDAYQRRLHRAAAMRAIVQVIQ